MSYVNAKRAAPAGLLCIAFFVVFFDFMFVSMIPTTDLILQDIGNILFLTAGVMIIAGLALIPGSRREGRKIRNILEIVAVRKEVRISDIQSETGLDSEYIRKIITDMLISHILFGYLEDDLFVRDTSGRPPFYGVQKMGVSGAY